ncbi:hypothetical protein [Gordonia sp. CPCC 205333]|uniref:hypothetical protein n=1 Tax=Gordonia sp. CPCC 205333 TaxID=3140790 RepID=UPI003AF357FD
MLTRAVRAICRIYGTMCISEKLWWAHKFFLGGVERAEEGSGIEEYFAAQDIHYSLPADFVEESSVQIASAGDILTSEHIRPEATSH